MLWMFQRVMFGEVTNPRNLTIKDLNPREIAVMAPLVALIFIMGVFPTPFIEKMTPAIDRMITLSKGRQHFIAKRTVYDGQLAGRSPWSEGPRAVKSAQ